MNLAQPDIWQRGANLFKAAEPWLGAWQTWAAAATLVGTVVSLALWVRKWRTEEAKK